MWESVPKICNNQVHQVYPLATSPIKVNIKFETNKRLDLEQPRATWKTNKGNPEKNYRDAFGYYGCICLITRIQHIRISKYVSTKYYKKYIKIDSYVLTYEGSTQWLIKNLTQWSIKKSAKGLLLHVHVVHIKLQPKHSIGTKQIEYK